MHTRKRFQPGQATCIRFAVLLGLCFGFYFLFIRSPSLPIAPVVSEVPETTPKDSSEEEIPVPKVGKGEFVPKEPKSVPKPVPKSAPTPVPQPKATPTPVPQPKATPKPVPQPVPQPVPVPVATEPKTVPIPSPADKRPPTVWTHKIPRIMHQLHRSEADVLPQDKMLRDKCKELMPEWKFEFWNDTRIENMIKERYPWYYPTWKSFTPFIKRVDTSRYILMHAFGGVYLDSDVECVKSLDDMITPLEGGAYSGAFPEPMFVMSEPGNKFWLHMMARINETRNRDTWSNTGPVGLHESFLSWVSLHGQGVILNWHKKEWVVTYDPICDNNAWSFSPWYWFEHIKTKSAQPFKPSTGVITPDMKIGFICNELLDPAACSAGALSHCVNSFCNRTWPHSFTVHHCRSTWRPRVGSNP